MSSTLAALPAPHRVGLRPKSPQVSGRSVLSSPCIAAVPVMKFSNVPARSSRATIGSLSHRCVTHTPIATAGFAPNTSRVCAPPARSCLASFAKPQSPTTRTSSPQHRPDRLLAPQHEPPTVRCSSPVLVATQGRQPLPMPSMPAISSDVREVKLTSCGPPAPIASWASRDQGPLGRRVGSLRAPAGPASPCSSSLSELHGSTSAHLWLSSCKGLQASSSLPSFTTATTSHSLETSVLAKPSDAALDMPWTACCTTTPSMISTTHVAQAVEHSSADADRTSVKQRYPIATVREWPEAIERTSRAPRAPRLRLPESSLEKFPAPTVSRQAPSSRDSSPIKTSTLRVDSTFSPPVPRLCPLGSLDDMVRRQVLPARDIPPNNMSRLHVDGLFSPPVRQSSCASVFSEPGFCHSDVDIGINAEAEGVAGAGETKPSAATLPKECHENRETESSPASREFSPYNRLIEMAKLEVEKHKATNVCNRTAPPTPTAQFMACPESPRESGAQLAEQRYTYPSIYRSYAQEGRTLSARPRGQGSCSSPSLGSRSISPGIYRRDGKERRTLLAKPRLQGSCSSPALGLRSTTLPRSSRAHPAGLKNNYLLNLDDPELIAASAERRPEGTADVVAQIYDFGQVPAALQELLRALDTGAFHVGIEVWGKEWAFGQTADDKFPSGVYCHYPPMRNPHHRFRESLSLGKTSLSREEVYRLVQELKERWVGKDYNVLSWNCVDFGTELCRKLYVSALPGYLEGLSNVIS